jgi:hypothetical protein
VNQSVNDLLPIEQAIEIKGASRPCLEESISSRPVCKLPFRILVCWVGRNHGARVSQRLARRNSRDTQSRYVGSFLLLPVPGRDVTGPGGGRHHTHHQMEVQELPINYYFELL